MNSMRYRGKTWKLGDFVYISETGFNPRRFGHILKLKRECLDLDEVGLFIYIADVIWQDGTTTPNVSMTYLELVNE